MLFTLFYVAWRALSRLRPHAAERSRKLPSARAIYGFIVALGLVSFVVRIWWPLGWWLQPFSLEVAYLPQYLSLYVLGLIAYRRNWFAELSPRMGKDWLRTTIVALLVAVLFMTLGGGVGTQIDYYEGGFHWQALIEAVWEAFMVVGPFQHFGISIRRGWRRVGELPDGRGRARGLGTVSGASGPQHPEFPICGVRTGQLASE